LNCAQIEALLRRINEENKKTKEVLETIQRNELRKELKVIRKLAASPSSIISRQEKTTTTFLDSLQVTLNLNNNNINNNNTTSKDKNGNGKSSPLGNKNNLVTEDFPLVTWETSGEGKKIPIVILNCLALSRPQPLSVGQKYHLTFKTVNADAKLVSQVRLQRGHPPVMETTLLPPPCFYNLHFEL
jgi:hypothetical protein